MGDRETWALLVVSRPWTPPPSLVFYQQLVSTYCVPGPVAFSPGRAPYPLKMSQVEYHPQERTYLPKLACLSAYCILTLCQGLYLQDTYWDGYPYFSDGESRHRERQYPAQSPS